MGLKDGQENPVAPGAVVPGARDVGERYPLQAPLGRSGDPDVDALGGAVTITKADALVAWGRKNSLWPIPFGTACCAIEFMGTVSSVFDLSRFGAEVVRFSPSSGRDVVFAGR